LDEDIIDSKHSLKDSEKINGEFVLPHYEEAFYNRASGLPSAGGLPSKADLVQLDSDPVCSSAGCTQYKHKKTKRGYDINYPVANNGVDQDMMDNEASLNQAQKDLSHDWEFGTKASKAKWKNPAKKTKYDFSPKLDS
jgi:hypothetical protein